MAKKCGVSRHIKIQNREDTLWGIFEATKNSKNTLIYTQLVTFQNDDYTCKVAASIKEAAELIEAGYEYVCEMDHQKLFRKRK